MGADIYLMNPDGSNVVRRTKSAAYWSVAWSPDGRTLAVSDEGIYYGSVSLISADDDGAPPRLLAVDARTPAWSPDGKQIAFVRLSGDDGYHRIFIMNADGTDQRPVTEFDSGGIFGLSWSPDGKRLAFSKCLQGSCGIYTMKPDGSDWKTVTTTSTGTGTAWSPDGKWISFTIDKYAGQQWVPSIAIVSSDGGALYIVDSGYSPSWQPGPTE
jgi:TolB protein